MSANPLSSVFSASLLREDFFSQAIDEDVDQDQAQHEPLGNTSYRPSIRLCTTDYSPLSCKPPHHSLIYLAFSEFHNKDAVGDSIKHLAEVKLCCIHCAPLIYPDRDEIIEGYQVGQNMISPS